MLTLYLAGAIRDAHPEDIAWREYLIGKVQHKHALDTRILNPVGDKTRNVATGEWKMGGIFAGAHDIVSQDLWCVRQADIIIANFSSFVDNYPSIGTVMEVGAAAGMGGKLIYSILDQNKTFGMENKTNFKLHPFLTEVSSSIFDSVDAFTDFFMQHLDMLTGQNPRFGGIVNG